MAKEAIKQGRPPKGLTPQIYLTAYSQTDKLKQDVDTALTSCGIQICGILATHYTNLLSTSREKLERLQVELNSLAESTTDPTEKQSNEALIKTLLDDINKKM